VTAAARYALPAAAMHERDPANVLAVLNETLGSRQDDDDFMSRWCTVIAARLDISADRAVLHVASGGHPLPYVVRADGRSEPTGGPGALVGALAEGQWATTSTNLADGDAVVFFTDGVTEARVGDGFFDTRGLETALPPAPNMAPEQVIEHLLGEMARLGAAHQDDIALLVL
jgi:sigma-B regulation protein RsbU (phosphoserine phosphatase)